MLPWQIYGNEWARWWILRECTCVLGLVVLVDGGLDQGDAVENLKTFAIPFTCA